MKKLLTRLASLGLGSLSTFSSCSPRPADQLKTLEKQVQQTVDLHQIQNLMGTMTYQFEAGKYEDMLAQFAQKTDGVTVEFANWGVYTGRAGAHKMIVERWQNIARHHAEGMKKAFPNAGLENDRAGLLDLTALASPVLEVAGDGKTAKGLWLVPGLQTEFNPQKKAPDAAWAWLKYAVDFVKEDGQWKVWHYHVFPCFRTSFHQSWVESSMAMDAARKNGIPPPPPFDDLKSDKPTTSIHAYNIAQAPAYDPKPPVPYETFSQTFSY